MGQAQAPNLSPLSGKPVGREVCTSFPLSSSSTTRKGQQKGWEDGDQVKDLGPPTRDQLLLAPESSPLPSVCFEIRSQVALAG